MDNTIWELREVHRCIGARLVKLQNKRAVYGPVPAPADPASFTSEPFSGVSAGLVNELIEEMDLTVLALRLCCVKIEIEREGLRGLLPPVLESVTAPGSGSGGADQDRDRDEAQQQQASQSLGGGRAGSSNGQSVVSMSIAERPHPLFGPPQTQFRPRNGNRNSHGSSKQEYAGVKQLETMKKPVPATTMELVFPKVETGVGGTLKDRAAPYEANKTGRSPQRESYTPASGFGNTTKSAEVERSSAAEKKSNTTTTTATTTSRRQPAQAPAHPPPARTTSLALPRSKAGATRKITSAVATNSKKSPDLVLTAPVSTPAPANGSSGRNHHYATNKDRKPQDNRPNNGGDDNGDQRDLAESERRRQYHRQQVASMTGPAHTHARAQAHQTQEAQQQAKHQHRIGSGTGTGITGDNQGHVDETKGVSIRPPITSEYNKQIPGTGNGTHSPSLIGNGNSNNKFVDSTTSASSYKYSDHHHLKKKKNSEIPNNTVKEDRREEKREEEEHDEQEEEENTRASRERGRGGGGGGRGLQKEDRSSSSSSFLGTVKGAIKGVFNGTMT